MRITNTKVNNKKQAPAFLLVLLTVLLFLACDNGRPTGEKNFSGAPNNPEPVYAYPLDKESADPTAFGDEGIPTTESGTSGNPDSASSNVKGQLSETYEEGYKVGYQAGEDDVHSYNSWGEHFDNSCDYHGKQLSDYQAGYEAGYEDGYHDNNDRNE